MKSLNKLDSHRYVLRIPSLFQVRLMPSGARSQPPVSTQRDLALASAFARPSRLQLAGDRAQDVSSGGDLCPRLGRESPPNGFFHGSRAPGVQGPSLRREAQDCTPAIVWITTAFEQFAPLHRARGRRPKAHKPDHFSQRLCFDAGP